MRITKIIMSAVALVSVLAGGVQAQAQSCIGNIVSNGDFTAGLVTGSMPAASVTDWSLLTATPQVVTDGCDAPGAVQMWGNLVVGESIMQLLPGPGIEAGKTYNVTVCYRWLDNNNPVLPQYVRVRLAASAALPTGYPSTSGYDLIGTTPNTSSTAWITHTFPNWTAPNNAAYLTINPENDSSLNDGNFVSWVQVDDVCISVVEATPTEQTSWGSIKTQYPVSQ